VGNDPWAQFLFILIAQSLTVAVIWRVLKAFKLGFRTIGLIRPQLRDIAYALAGFAIYFVAYLAILIVATQLLPGLDLEKEQEIGFSKDTAGMSLLLVFVSLVIIPPLTEEIVMRGFMFTGLRARFAFWPATAVVSLLFALAHLGGAAEGVLWVAALDTLVLSVVLCWLRERSGSLWPPIGLHFIKNGIAFFVLFNMARFFR
jgi:membrane protease YdiL (CAAX protease family)